MKIHIIRSLVITILVIAVEQSVHAQFVLGCTDSEACNYNPEATVNVNCNYGLWYFVSIPGSFSSIQRQCEDGPFSYLAECQDCAEQMVNHPDLTCPGVFSISSACYEFYYSCMENNSCLDPTACNYNANALCDLPDECIYDPTEAGWYLSPEGSNSPAYYGCNPPQDYSLAPCQECAEFAAYSEPECESTVWDGGCDYYYDLALEYCSDQEACNYNVSEGSYGIFFSYGCVLPPPNDNCVDAIPLYVFQTSDFKLVDNRNSCTVEPYFVPPINLNQSDCYTQNSWCYSDPYVQSPLYYSFICPYYDAIINIRTSVYFDAYYDTQLAVLDGCNGNLIAANDQFSYLEDNAQIVLHTDQLEANQEYIILVDGHDDERGICYLEYAVTPLTITGECPADLNHDDEVTAGDLTLFLTAFGTSCSN